MKLQYCKSLKVKLQLILIINRENKPIKKNNDHKAMSTMVNQVSSVRFDNKLLRKSLHNEINFNKCEFREKFCEFISLIINSVEDS